jgi:mitotic spindle assembly checkpoint protein MAD2B
VEWRLLDLLGVMTSAAPDHILDNFQALITTFCDFLIVAIHTILYERGIYPQATFISARKYNLPVRQNRHPKVCQWIVDAVAAVEKELQKATVARVVVVITSPDAKPLERFVFDVSSFPEIPPGELLTEFEVPDEEDEEVAENGVKVNLVDVEEQLRATIMKLAHCGGRLGTLPAECSYTVVIELKDQANAPIGHPQPWVPCEPSQQKPNESQGKRVGADLGGVKSVPVRLVEAGAFVLETWIEEGKAKGANG